MAVLDLLAVQSARGWWLIHTMVYADKTPIVALLKPTMNSITCIKIFAVYSRSFFAWGIRESDVFYYSKKRKHG
jgi:hypothetical protein